MGWLTRKTQRPAQPDTITRRQITRSAEIRTPGRFYDTLMHVKIVGDQVELCRDEWGIRSFTLSSTELEQLVRFAEECRAREEMGQA